VRLKQEAKSEEMSKKDKRRLTNKQRRQKEIKRDIKQIKKKIEEGRINPETGM
jgi:hypothetical protein